MKAGQGLTYALLVLAVTVGIGIFAASIMNALPVPGRGAETGRPDDPADGNLTFSDVASDIGIDFEHGGFHFGFSADPTSMMGSGVCWIDYDNDGWMDLFAVNNWTESELSQWQDEGGVPSSRLYRNERGSFVDLTAEAEIDLTFHGQGCVAADFDDDGRADLFVTSTRGNALLRNTGLGTFEEEADAAGVRGDGWYTGASAGDVNGDGTIDLFVAGYVDPGQPGDGSMLDFPAGYTGVRDLMLLNRGDGTFVDAAGELGIDADVAGYGLGGTLVDVDLDGDLDLVVVNDLGPNRLYLNRPAEAPLGFEMVDASERLGEDGSSSGGLGLEVGDYDRDGGLDLFFTGRDEDVLLRNVEDGFEQVPSVFQSDDIAPEFTGTGVTWADFDLDLDLDLLIVHGGLPVTGSQADVQPLMWWANTLDSTDQPTYVDRSQRARLDPIGTGVGRGSAAADYDNDGDLDVAVNSVGGPLALYSNRGAGGHWIGVDMPDAGPGTVVEVVLENGEILRRQVIAGSSYMSSSDRRVVFGIGTSTRVQSVTVTQPDGTTIVYRSPGADRYIGDE